MLLWRFALITSIFSLDKAEIGVALAHEAKHEGVDGLRHVQGLVVLDENGLQLVVIEGLVAKFNVLVADVGEHGRLRVQVIVLARLRHDASLDVAKKATQHSMRVSDNSIRLDKVANGKRASWLSQCA